MRLRGRAESTTNRLGIGVVTEPGEIGLDQRFSGLPGSDREGQGAAKI